MIGSARADTPNDGMVPILGGKYQVGVKIGSGSFGEIFLARSFHSHSLRSGGEDVAVKMEDTPDKSSQLRREAKIYLRLAGEGELHLPVAAADLVM